MSQPCKLIIKDYVNCKFEGLDPVTRRKFLTALKFMCPWARHTPQFKLKRWDGMIAFGTISGATYINMLDLVLPIIIDAGYEIEIEDRRPDFDVDLGTVQNDELSSFLWPPGHAKAGEPIMLRDHQVEAINQYFRNTQSLQSIATGAGKTVICSTISRRVEQVTSGRTIVIVPSKSLVGQTEEDYRNVGLDVGVFYGEKKEISCQHTICTWQSLSVLAKNTRANETDFSIDEFLEGVVAVICDECHNLKGNVLRDLMCGPLANIPLRWGMSGTIPSEPFEFYPALSSIGNVVGQVEASDLQDLGILAGCKITVKQLQDDHVEFGDYPSENDFLNSDITRLTWVAKFAEEIMATGNTLLLVDRIETGEIFEAMIPGSVFISGRDKIKTRKKEYDSIQTSNNKIIIATYGVAKEGINIPKLFNLICLNFGKSYYKVIQSIGRVLRVSGVKTFANIYDVCSSLKYSKRHLTRRKEYYENAKYKFTVEKIKYR